MGSSAIEMPVNFKGDMAILNTGLMASRFCNETSCVVLKHPVKKHPPGLNGASFAVVPWPRTELGLIVCRGWSSDMTRACTGKDPSSSFSRKTVFQNHTNICFFLYTQWWVCCLVMLVQSHIFTLSWVQSINNRQLIAHPWWGGMGPLSWVQSLICVLLLFATIDMP